MAPVTSTTPKFKLSASVVASYFKHKCDRNFRYSIVETADRQVRGIGWNVPKKQKAHSRPGVNLLMKEGDKFEVSHVRALLAQHGETGVYTAGFNDKGKVNDVPLFSFIGRLTEALLPQFVPQLAIDLGQLPEWEEKFLDQFGLNAAKVRLATAKPDLLEIVPLENGTHQIRIWDFKASQAARHDHFIQVAFYSLLLNFALREAGVTGIAVNMEEAVIQSRKGEEVFELAPYRSAVRDFLQNKVPELLATKAAEAHFHIEDHCAMCEYMDHCRAEADAGYDLSRIPYLSSESKRRLRNRGIRSHHELAELDDAKMIFQLKQASHDLSVNLEKYIQSAGALEDGEVHPLNGRTMLMPGFESVRIVLSAEQDAVTGTCFALGLKVYAGWDEATGKPKGDEKVFIARERGGERAILLPFLKALNQHLQEADAHNKSLYNSMLADAEQACTAAEEALAAFKVQHPGRLYKARPEHAPLLAQREGLQETLDQAKKNLQKVRNGSHYDLFRSLVKLHLYCYDSYDLFVLRSLIERQLFAQDQADQAEMLHEIGHLVRLFPPSDVLPDAATFRTIPGTVVTQVLRQLVALPIPYLYELKEVSRIYKPHNQSGEENGFEFNYRYGFGWEFTNQLAFERIHDLWEGKPFQTEKRTYTPEEILQQLEATILSKLRATDSVIRRIKEQFGPQLLLRKEPFRLYTDYNPLDYQTLEALKIFTLLETSLDELDVKHTHTQALEDRATKFVCIRGLQHITGSDGEDGSLWFTFDAGCKDAKFEVGDFNLVVTHEDNPRMLLWDIDGMLFENARYRSDPYKVTLMAYDHKSDPPRLRLLPYKPDMFKQKVDLSKVLTLDKLYVDYNSGKVIDVLNKLNDNPENALHIQSCLQNTPIVNWVPVVPSSEELEREMHRCLALAGQQPGNTLNQGQWAAWRGVYGEPVTLLWGPPGTGKTHTIAHMLIGYALAAKTNSKPIRILVTAFTHHAITNVLNKVVELSKKYQLPDGSVSIVKFTRGRHAADAELLPEVEKHLEETMATQLACPCPCVIAGATVWGTYKGMDETEQIIQPWFDVVLVDEASQMKLPDALIAFSASKPNSNIILAGDDQQLPPIIHGEYPEQQEFMLSSVFAFIRHQINQAQTFDPTIHARRLFQLSENFRMNEPITAYPRDILYEGNFQSANPSIRIQTVPAIAPESTDLLDFLLHPDRPVVLCWYTPPVSYTARNPVEAELIASLAARLSRILVDRKTSQCYAPEKFASHGLGVLSPHRAQNSIIRQYLVEQGFDFERTPLLVDTVEKLQGKEREVILVSYGVADEEYATAEAGFLLNRNRFNVAITRALCKVIVFCSEPVLNVVSTDRKVLLESMMLKEFRSYCDTGHQTIAWKPSACDELNLHIQWKGF